MIDINSLMVQWNVFLNEVTQGNEMMSAGISLWALGVVTYLARNVPQRIYELIKRHSITSMTMNNATWYQEQTFVNFVRWLQPKINESMSRTLAIESVYDDDNDERSTVIGIGYGIHFFFYNRRLFWIQKSQLESSGSEKQKEQIAIYTFGRSHEPFKKLLKDFVPKPDKEKKLYIYRFSIDNVWVRYCEIPKRPLKTVAIEDKIKDTILKHIDDFEGNREWYYERGIPYKITYMLHGKPGTGKTSLIKALASHFSRNVCIINISSMTDSGLEAALAKVPKNSFVIIEDFDSSGATKNREKPEVKAVKADAPATMFDDGVMFSALSLTGLLNALDGVVPLDNCILFLTTNHLEKIDKAVYRKGRVDYIYEIGDVKPQYIRRYIKNLYPDYDCSHVNFKPMTGCHLNEALLYGKDNPDDFIECLVNNGYATLNRGSKSHYE